MATDDFTISNLINAISEPVFVIIPSKLLPDEDLVRIFNSLEEILTKIEEKTKVKFDILIESAEYFGGYDEGCHPAVSYHAGIPCCSKVGVGLPWIAP